MTLQAPATWPRSFADPLYAQLAATVEQRFGLPSGILDAIRNHGEMSNADQVSSAGAQTPYQVIPATRRGLMRNYGVDAYASPEDATVAAGQLLKENYGRTHSWDDAVRMYHGGTDKRNWGPQNRAYAARVGSFEGQSMPQRSLYDGPDIPGSFDPNYVEPPRDAVPVPGDPGPSQSIAAASPLANKKRRGILGTIGHVLGEVFMPQPDSLWAGALRDGIVNARESQANYKANAEKGTLNNMLLTAKVKQMLTKGEYQVVGNNVFHFPPDGGEPQIITPPQTKNETERLIDMWKTADASDPAKELIRQILLKGNSQEVLDSRERAAQIRAGATTQSARIRASTQSRAPQVPQGWTVVK